MKQHRYCYCRDQGWVPVETGPCTLFHKHYFTLLVGWSCLLLVIWYRNATRKGSSICCSSFKNIQKGTKNALQWSLSMSWRIVSEHKSASKQCTNIDHKISKTHRQWWLSATWKPKVSSNHCLTIGKSPQIVFKSISFWWWNLAIAHVL
jgi:hypothetical protein